MNNGIPLAYTLYRVIWSIVHIALAGFAVGFFIAAFAIDGNGPRTIAAIWEGLAAAQRAVGGAIPFPWGY